MKFREIVLLLVAIQILFKLVHSLPTSPVVDDKELPLYELDDWNKCDIGPGKDWYCVVRVILSGDAVTNSAPVFEVNDLRRFRRTLLDRGICLAASRRTASNVSTLTGTSFPASWNQSDRYVLNRDYFPVRMHPDHSTERAVSDEINRRIVAQYRGLAAYTEIEYCLKSDPKPEFEQAIGVSLAVALALGCVLLLNTRQWIGKLFKAPSTKHHPIKQFALFDMYKCFGSVGVVLAHCCLFGPFLVPMKNIELLEEFIAHPNAKLWRLLCPFLMLMFFTMSSMLLTVKLLRTEPSDRPTFGAIIMNRLIRLVPLNLLLIGFATFAYDRFSGGGPLGSRQLMMEQGFCRSYWWMNVLFISNFNMRKPCLPDSWYVSADFQLYVLITLAILAMFRMPKHIRTIVAFMIACSFLGPFLTVLWSDFDPVGPSNLHEMRFFLLDSNFMAQLYTPFYNNLAWSVSGMVAGIIYDQFQRTESSTESQKRILHNLNLSLMILLAILVLSICATITASEDESQHNRWWLAVCYSTYKLSAASFFGAFFLRIIIAEKDIHIPPIVRMGATLYYCIYLIHFPVMRIVYCSDVIKETIVTPFFLLRKALKVFGITYILSVLLHYTYENSAINVLRRICFSRS